MAQGQGIAAYDIPERIASYDRDMDVMHPNRHKMVQVALDLLPFENPQGFRSSGSPCLFDSRRVALHGLEERFRQSSHQGSRGHRREARRGVWPC